MSAGPVASQPPSAIVPSTDATGSLNGARAPYDWRTTMIVTSGYISVDGLVEAEVGFNDSIGCWQWFVGVYDDKTHSGIVKCGGGVAESDYDGIEKANAWMKEQGV